MADTWLSLNPGKYPLPAEKPVVISGAKGIERQEGKKRCQRNNGLLVNFLEHAVVEHSSLRAREQDDARQKATYHEVTDLSSTGGKRRLLLSLDKDSCTVMIVA